MNLDIWIATRIKTCIEICIAMCMDMCIELCTEMCIDMHLQHLRALRLSFCLLHSSPG